MHTSGGRAPVRYGRGGAGPVYAAIDLGTNNCRLLVARQAPDGFRVMDAYSRIVRLGEGIGVSNRLAAAAMDRTMSALAVCCRRMRRRNVTFARCVATEACRRASNGEAFVERVRQELGLSLEVVTAEEEARLALEGCLPLVDPEAAHVLLFDIGGGSTELVWLSRESPGARPQMRAFQSLPLGVVALSERFGAGGAVDRDLYNVLRDSADDALTAFDPTGELAGHFAAGRAQLLGTSGTVTTLAALFLGLVRYDRAKVDGGIVPTEGLDAATARVCAMSPHERASHGCIGRGRADLVVAGCAVLQSIVTRWHAPTMTVADRGVREGILLELMRANRERRAGPWHVADRLRPEPAPHPQAAIGRS